MATPLWNSAAAVVAGRQRSFATMNETAVLSRVTPNCKRNAISLRERLVQVFEEEHQEFIQDPLKQALNEARSNPDPFSAILRLYTFLKNGVEANQFQDDIYSIAKDVVFCPSIQRLCDHLASDSLSANDLTRTMELAICDAPKNVSVTEFATQLLNYGRKTSGDSLSIENCWEYLRSADEQRATKRRTAWPQPEDLPRLFPSDDRNEDISELDTSSHEKYQLTRPPRMPFDLEAGSDELLVPAKNLWTMLTLNALSPEAHSPRKPFRITTLRGSTSDDVVLKVTLYKQWNWFVQTAEFAKQDLLDRHSLFLRERELPAVVNSLIYALSPDASKHLTGVILAGDSGIGKSTLINLMLVFCAVFRRHLFSIFVGEQADDLECMVFLSNAKSNKPGWISTVPTYQTLPRGGYPLELAIWFDMRRSSRKPTEFGKLLQLPFGSVWSLSPRHAFAAVDFEIPYHWMDEWHSEELRLLIPFVMDELTRNNLESALKDIYACVGGSLRSVLHVARLAGVDGRNLREVLCDQINRALSRMLKTGKSADELVSEPNSTFIHQVPVSGGTLTNMLTPIPHMIDLDFKRCPKSLSQFRTDDHAALLLSEAEPSLIHQLLEMLSRPSKVRHSGEIFENVVIRSIDKTKAFIITRKGFQYSQARELSAFMYNHIVTSPILRDICKRRVTQVTQLAHVICVPLGDLVQTSDFRTESVTKRGDIRGTNVDLPKPTVEAQFFSDAIDRHCNDELPAWFIPEDLNVVDHDATLYIPPSRGPWAKAILSPKTVENMLRIVNPAILRGNAKSPIENVNWDLGTLIMIQFKSGDSITKNAVKLHNQSVGRLQKKLVKLGKNVNLFGLVVISGKSEAITRLGGGIKNSIDTGEVAVIDEYAVFASHLYRGHRILKPSADNQIPDLPQTNAQ